MAHRLLKPSYFPELVPRDVIAKIHYFHVKDQLMYFSHTRNSLPEPYSGISLYTDLSQATIQVPKNLIIITKILRNINIPNAWKFSTKLSIEKNNKTSFISTLEEGLELVKTWGLLSQKDIADPPAHSQDFRNGQVNPNK